MFVTTDTNRYHLKVPRPNHERWLHLATIQKGVREFMLFVDLQTSKAYIEEITGGSLEKIEDDQLHQDLVKFCELHQLSSLAKQ